jgi:hypothetical protein
MSKVCIYLMTVGIRVILNTGIILEFVGWRNACKVLQTYPKKLSKILSGEILVKDAFEGISSIERFMYVRPKRYDKYTCEVCNKTLLSVGKRIHESTELHKRNLETKDKDLS